MTNKEIISVICKNLESNFYLILGLKGQSEKIRKQYFLNLAKTISNQLPELQVLDRDNVEDILVDFHSWVLSWQTDNADKKPKKGFWTHNREFNNFIDQICQLIPPTEKLGAVEEIEDIVVKYCCDGVDQDMGVIIPYKDMGEFTKELSNLSKPSGEVIAKLQRHIDMQNLTIAGLEEQLEGIPKTTPYLNTAEPEQGEVIAEGKCKVKNVSICYRDGTTEWKQKIFINGKEFKLSEIDGKNIIVKVAEKK